MSNLLEQASLVLIPSGYKEGVVYSEIPLDGSGDMTFVRASDGTRINSAGLVEVVPWNLLQYSEDFSNAYWSKDNSTITTNSTTAPNGTTTADTFTKTISSSAYLYNGSFALQIGEYTQSVYAKANASSSIRLEFVTGAFVRGAACIFDLSNGTAGSVTVYGGVSGFTATIESVGDGWYRCSLGGSITIADTYFWEISITTGSIYLWGAQLNTGSTAKPYFPTTNRQDVPRLTYQNGGGGCPSLLLEKQSTNVLSYSNTGDWGLSPSIAKTQNTTDLLSPDGTNNATKIVASAGTGDTSQGFSIADGAITFSFWGRVASGTKTLVVDLRNNSSAIVSSSPVLTTEWQRFTVTNSVGGTGSSGAVWIYPNGAGTFYIYGAQVEVGSYATSTILTQGSSVTRLADIAYKTSATALIGQTEGVLFCDFNLPSVETSVDYPFVVNMYGSINNRFGFARYPNGGVHIYMVVGGSGQFTYNTTQLTGRFKLALGYKANDCVIYLNGTLLQTITSASIPTTDEIVLNAINSGGAYNSQSQINQLVLFKTRLTNAQLASLTTL